MINKPLVSQPFSGRVFVVAVIHALAFAVAYLLAFLVRGDFVIPAEEKPLFLLALPAFVLIKLAIFYYLGQYHRSWRSVAFSDLASLLWAAFLSTLIIVAVDHLTMQDRHIPRLVFPLDWALTVLILGGLRSISRLTREELRSRFHSHGAAKSLIVGANQSGQTLARHLQSNERTKYTLLGYLDLDGSRTGSMLGGLPILGTPDQAPYLAARHGVEQLLVISGTLTGKQLRGLMENTSQIGVGLKVIPAIDDLLAGDFSVQIRDVDINDLLRREPVQLNSDAIESLLARRTVLVTGAGGSIGSEICRQALKFHPQRLVLVERAENNLFLIEQELRRSKTETEIIAAIADITDFERINQVFVDTQPHVVFHAAAHKHVPMMESNPGEAIKNNVLGTRQLVEISDRHGVQEFVMISTDKAVNPTSMMGVSKQIAERYVHAYSELAGTKFVVVRFGNVLASAGSVVPIFQDQIRRGGPITVTHPEIERFFMTIPEASQLVLQAAAMGKGGEIFVLDMGESVRIVDLARDLVRLSGLKPDDIEIAFTGLRPGEKLYEELYFEDEEMLPTPHPKLFVAYHRTYQLDDVTALIGRLAEVAHEPAEVVRQRVRELVPEYSDPATAPDASDSQPTHGPTRRSGPATPRLDAAGSDAAGNNAVVSDSVHSDAVGSANGAVAGDSVAGAGLKK